jgi:hypothetical protein
MAWAEDHRVTVDADLPPLHQAWVLTHELSAHVAGLGHLPYPARSSYPLTDVEPPLWEVELLAQRGTFHLTFDLSLHDVVLEAMEFWNSRCGRDVFIVGVP